MEPRQEKLDPYSELIRNKEDSIWPLRAQEFGLTFKWPTGIQSETFQLMHEVEICRDNPMHGLVPGAPATKSGNKLSGMLIRGLDMTDPTSRPTSHHQFEVNSEFEINANNILNLSENKSLRLASNKDTNNQTSLIRELEFRNSTTDSCTSLCIAQPKFLSDTGFRYEGVAVGNYFKKLSSKFNIGGEMTYTNMKTPQGMQKQLVGGFGGCINWLDPKIAKMGDPTGKYAETALKVTCHSFSILPSDITMNHWCKSRVQDPGFTAAAQLAIKPSPMAVYSGNMAKEITGKLMYSYQLRDPTKAKNLPMGIPQPDKDTSIRTMIDSDYNIGSMIETHVEELPISLAFKALYNIKKDELKLGLSMAMMSE